MTLSHFFRRGLCTHFKTCCQIVSRCSDSQFPVLFCPLAAWASAAKNDRRLHQLRNVNCGNVKSIINEDSRVTHSLTHTPRNKRERMWLSKGAKETLSLRNLSSWTDNFTTRLVSASLLRWERKTFPVCVLCVCGCTAVLYLVCQVQAKVQGPAQRHKCPLI